MKDSNARLSSEKNGRLHSKYIRNRQSLINERFKEKERWERLFKEVEKRRPDYVILIARKIPRLYQLLQASDKSSALTAPVFSDYAIEHIPDIAGSRVAVIDDVINVGTSVAMTAKRLRDRSAKEIFCYALDNRDNINKLELEKYADKIEYESSSAIDEKEYRRSTKKRAQVLMLLNRPFEIGFPVFRLQQSGGFNLDKFKGNLENFSRKAHKLDESLSPYAGLTRYSIDLNTKRGLNDKWRLYIDEAEEQICFVPMPQLFNPGNLHAETKTPEVYRTKLYREALKFAYASLPIIKKKLGMESMWLMEKETNLAFGSLMLPDTKQAPSSPEALDQFLERPDTSANVFLKEWQQSAENRRWVRENSCTSIDDCMIKFFTKLGADQKCDNPDLQNTPIEELYDRLRKGPTFQELVIIIGNMLNVSLAQQDNLHWAISQALDEQIDQGFVVPAISKEGERIFRKGEPAPYSRMDSRIARSLGLPDSYGEDWPEFNSIPLNARREFMEIRQQLQKRI